VIVGKDLHEIVVNLIVEKGTVSGSKLASVLEQKDICSRAQTYRILKELVDKEVLLRPKKGAYSINMFWLWNMSDVIDRASRNILKMQSSEGGLPSSGEAVRRQFSSFRTVYSFWNHYLAIILSKTTDDRIFSWIPHPWFRLVPKPTLSSMIACEDKPKAVIYTILGGDTFLDRWGNIEIDGKVHVSNAIGPFEDQRSLYFDLTDDYIISIKLDKRTTDALDALYSEIKDMSAESFNRIQNFLDEPISATVTCENRPKKAKMLKKTFEDFWGF
ncbi:MAG: hypothetical protein KDD62_12710, partial [Bdellovibrionales bacterium]|nr:hypothetical protein [Bdellovibrionales bacterium]